MNGFTATEYNESVEHLNTVVAAHIENILVGLGHKQDKIIFGLCGGRSVGAIFELLGRNVNIPWGKVHFFMVDERLVPLDSDDSNYKLAADILINPLKEKGFITYANCHPFILDEKASDFGVQKYSNELASVGGKFDVVILSGGEDGHIGAIYPNHHSFEDESDLYIYMTDSPKPPPERMSASKSLILRTQTALLLVMGESKADLYKKLGDDSVEPKDCPAKLLTQLPSSYLITTHKD